MALLQCPECTKDVSSYAKTCPHCGYPLEDHIKELEIKRLTEKILPCEFTVPEPRRKVCIKCTQTFQYVNPTLSNFKQPMCSCGMPGVEIDCPQAGVLGWEQDYYVLEHCCKPRSIGDYDSQEYNERIAKFEQYEKKFNTKIVLKAPDPKYFGITPEQNWRRITSSASSKPEPLLPRCPFCSSTDLTKISSFGKAAKTSLFGLFGADDLGKTWKCNNCGGKF